jgi:hypothetical protein
VGECRVEVADSLAVKIIAGMLSESTKINKKDLYVHFTCEMPARKNTEPRRKQRKL